MINTLENYICYKSLALDEYENHVVFLGYELKTTKTEYAILHALIKRHGKPLSAEELSAITALDLTSERLSYHIFNINEKAKAIGERPLIKNIAKNGYFLNEEM